MADQPAAPQTTQNPYVQQLVTLLKNLIQEQADLKAKGILRYNPGAAMRAFNIIDEARVQEPAVDEDTQRLVALINVTGYFADAMPKGDNSQTSHQRFADNLLTKGLQGFAVEIAEIDQLDFLVNAEDVEERDEKIKAKIAAIKQKLIADLRAAREQGYAAPFREVIDARLEGEDPAPPADGARPARKGAKVAPAVA